MPLTFIKIGRIFYGLCLIGLGFQQFQYGDFRPVFAPDWPGWLHHSVLAYIFGAALVLAGGTIALAKNARKVALITATVFLLFFLLFHFVFLSLVSPDKFSLGGWTNALKELALSGGALIVAGSYQQPNTVTNDSFFSWLEKLIPFGRFFFGFMLACFGIDHFLYAQFVATLVPSWIPGSMFWTYFAGIALFGAGVAIILNIRIKQVAMLTAIMIFVWFLVLHIPRGMADPEGLKGNEITSVFQALGFAGVLLVLSLNTSESRTLAVPFPNKSTS